MKQLVLLTFCIYFSCFGAASSNAADGALQAFTESFLRSSRAQDPDNAAALLRTTDPGFIAFSDSKRNDPDVVKAVSPLICMLPNENTPPYQFAYTSIGKNQLFVCLVAGQQLEKYACKIRYPSLVPGGIAHNLVHSMRSYWDLRLLGRDYTGFKKRGCHHYPYLLSRMDIRGAIAMMNSRTNGQLHNDKPTVAFFNTSVKGLQAFFYDFEGKFKERHYKSVKTVSVGDVGTLQFDTPKIIAYFSAPNQESTSNAKRLQPEYELALSQDSKRLKIVDVCQEGEQETEFEALHPEDELTDDE